MGMCQGGRIPPLPPPLPHTELQGKKKPGEVYGKGSPFSSALMPALTLTSSVNLDSGSTVRMDEEGPMCWRTLSACGLLKNGSLGLPPYSYEQPCLSLPSEL